MNICHNGTIRNCEGDKLAREYTLVSISSNYLDFEKFVYAYQSLILLLPLGLLTKRTSMQQNISLKANFREYLEVESSTLLSLLSWFYETNVETYLELRSIFKSTKSLEQVSYGHEDHS